MIAYVSTGHRAQRRRALPVRPLLPLVSSATRYLSTAQRTAHAHAIRCVRTTGHAHHTLYAPYAPYAIAAPRMRIRSDSLCWSTALYSARAASYLHPPRSLRCYSRGCCPHSRRSSWHWSCARWCRSGPWSKSQSCASRTARNPSAPRPTAAKTAFPVVGHEPGRYLSTGHRVGDSKLRFMLAA